MLVGIDQYQLGAKWSLSGARTDAVRWGMWLRERGVPAANITVLVSPTEDLTDLGWDGPVRPADRQTVQEVLLREVPAQGGDLFWFAWSGHGLLDGRELRRLIYADAIESDRRNLSFDSLLRTYRSDLVVGFRRQAFFVDACQTYLGAGEPHSALPAETLQVGRPSRDHEQFVLFAGRVGDAALDLGRRRGGAFSHAVHSALANEEPGVGWPPDLERLALQVRETFVQRRIEGRARQTPIYLWHRSFTGDESYLHQRDAEPTGPGGSSARLDLARVNALVNALIEIPAFQDPAQRTTLLGVLRAGNAQYLVDSLPRHSATRAEAVSMVLKFGTSRAALLELVEAVALLADTVEQVDRLRGSVDALTVGSPYC